MTSSVRHRRRVRWLIAASVLAVCMLALARSTGWRASTAFDDETSDGTGANMVRRGEVLVVRGSPGWNSLSAGERDRAETPLSDPAREWLRAEQLAVRRVSAAFGVSPVALGGIVAAEKTLLVGRVDAMGEELFRAVFGSLRERDLERWVADQEAAFQRGEGAAGSAGGWTPVRHPYLWTLGPAQVSFRLAIQYEPVVASRLGRPERDARAILNSLTSMPGNLEYAAALLAEAERAYRELAGMDISRNPGVLATLYHLGAPTVRARRLAEDNHARRARGEPALPPHVNYYGAFVNHHAGEITALIRTAGQREEEPGRASGGEAVAESP